MRIISQCKTKSIEFYNVALLRRDETLCKDCKPRYGTCRV